MNEKREFLRIKIKLKIGYEIVSWKEKSLLSLKDPNYSESFDISARGIGLGDIPILKKHGVMKHLLTGKKKLRIAIYINENDPPFISFARMVWTNYKKDMDKNTHIRCGLNLIDIPLSTFEKLKDFINENLDKKK